MAIAQVVRLMVSATYQGAVVCNNTFHFANDSGSTGPGLNPSDLATDFALAMITTAVPAPGAWRSKVCGIMSFNNLYYDRLYPNASGSGNIGLGGVVGTMSTNVTQPVNWGFSMPVPVVCAGITTWKTGVGGRSGRGRTYWPGLRYSPYSQGINGISPETDVFGGGAGSGPRSHIIAISQALLTRYSPVTPLFNGWYLVVRSTKTTGTAVPINPVGCYPVTDFSVPNYWGTMGSRRGGHGI